jgi:hypothetical protein
MYGLFLRALQGYCTATFGEDRWARILVRADMPPDGFEPLLAYSADDFARVMDAARAVLDRPPEVILEDLGTYIVTDPRLTAPRRLLRFCGATFAEFLGSLEELPDRARLALPDVEVPPLQIDEPGRGAFRIRWQTDVPEMGHLLLGVLRALADDYGALVFIEAVADRDGRPVLSVRLAAARFARGRSFALAATA